MNVSAESKSANADAMSRGTLDWRAAFTPGRLGLIVLLLIFVQYPDVLLGRRSFFNSDFGLFTYPVIHYLRDSIWGGQVPLWNPLNDCGVPFLAQWNTTACYPPVWLCAFGPLPWSLNYLCLGHLVLAGVGMYWLAHRWTEDPFAASVAGVAYALSGLMFNCLMWTSNLAALSWMPIVVLWAERGWREGGRGIVLAALAGGMQMLTGAPEIIFLTWLLLGTLWLGQIGQPMADVRRSGFSLALVVLFVGGLCAVQLLPFFELLRHSDRDPGQNPGAWSMPVWGWANFVVPLFRCSRSILGPYFQVNQQWTTSYYTGVGTVGLALVALWRVRTPRVWWLGAVAVSGTMLALGSNGFLYGIVNHLFPGVGLARYPIKFLAPTLFALPLLAAFAIKWLGTAPRSGRDSSVAKTLAFSGIFLLIVIIGVVAYARIFPYPEESSGVTLRNAAERAVFLVLILGLAFRQSRTAMSKPRTLFGLGVMLLLGLDTVTHAPRQNPTVDVAAYGPLSLGMSSLPTIGESRAMVSPLMRAVLNHAATTNALHYYVNNRRALYEDCNMPEGLPKVDGFFSLHLKEEMVVERLLDNPTNLPEGLADFVGVSQVSSSQAWFEWTGRQGALPWATAGQQPVFADGVEALKGLASPQFDPRRQVYLPLEARQALSVTNGAAARVTSTAFSAHEVKLSVSSPEPALVVISQAWYPCWQASVDGKRSRIWPANYAFQAVEIPGGQHEVELTYRDNSFRLGATMSGITLAGLLFYLRKGWSRRSGLN